MRLIVLATSICLNLALSVSAHPFELPTRTIGHLLFPRAAEPAPLPQTSVNPLSEKSLYPWYDAQTAAYKNLRERRWDIFNGVTPEKVAAYNAALAAAKQADLNVDANRLTFVRTAASAYEKNIALRNTEREQKQFQGDLSRDGSQIQSVPEYGLWFLRSGATVAYGNERVGTLKVLLDAMRPLVPPE